MHRSIHCLAPILILGLCLNTAFAQPASSELEPEAYFDFWLGTWDLSWEDANGTTGTGRNHIERVLDGHVIKENFEAHSGALEGFVGKSYSVYQVGTGSWKQTWVDNQGGYLDFTGEIDGDTRIFKREGTDRQGNAIIQRMRFHDIADDSLIWDWEVSNDDGKSWQLRWRIEYQRAD